MSRIFAIHGLRVRSEYILSAARIDGAAFDVDVRCGTPRNVTPQPAGGELIAALDLGQGHGTAHVRCGDGSYLLRYFGLAEFRIRSGLDQITVQADASIPVGMVNILLSGSVMSVLLALRGETVLHASAVEHNNQLIAFAGFSGQGKSTMATWLCAHGAALVTDDVLRVTPRDGACVAWSGATELRLREGARKLADDFFGAANKETADGRTVVRPATYKTGIDPYPICAIVVPYPDRGIDELKLARLATKDALVELLKVPRVLGWKDMTVPGRDFEVLTDVCRSVPVYEARVPWGPPFREDVAHALLALLSTREAKAHVV